jgi:hypothetical protein
MRVQTYNLVDFLDNLKQSDVVGKTVWVNRTENPVNGDRRTAAKFSVVFQATAVCQFEQGELLLDLGVDCGFDYRDCSQDDSASKEAARLRAELIAFCEERGLIVRPGIVDM